MERTRKLLQPLFIAAVALMTGAADAASQEQSPQAEGRTRALPVSAEQWFRPGMWLLTAHVGGAAFTDFQRARVRTVENVNVGEFDRRISASTSLALSGSVAYWGGTSWGLRAGATYVPTRFSVHTDDRARILLREHSTGEEQRYASLDIWMADIAIAFRFPHALGRVVPYGVAGAGVVRYRVRGTDNLPPEARDLADGSRWSPSAVFGIGAALPLQRNNLLLSFELTNHLARSPLDDSGNDEPFDVSGVPLQSASDTGAADSDGIGMTSNMRLSIGLTLPLRLFRAQD